jgi:hypothetical protein
MLALGARRKRFALGVVCLDAKGSYALNQHKERDDGLATAPTGRCRTEGCKRKYPARGDSRRCP